MKTLLTLILAVFMTAFSGQAHGQATISPTLLLNIPAGDTQRVVLAGFRHCSAGASAPLTCTVHGSQLAALFGQGGDLYDRVGDNFFAPYTGPSTLTNGVITIDPYYLPYQYTPSKNIPFYLLHANGAVVKFADQQRRLTCTQTSSSSATVSTAIVTHVSFNLATNTLQLATYHSIVDYTATDSGSTVHCDAAGADVVFGGFQGYTQTVDQTYAYVTITGSVL